MKMRLMTFDEVDGLSDEFICNIPLSSRMLVFNDDNYDPDEWYSEFDGNYILDLIIDETTVSAGKIYHA